MVDRGDGSSGGGGGNGYLYVGLSKGTVRRGDHHQMRSVRIPIDRLSIAGYCALTGEPCNVPDAYADRRFDRAVDVATSYRTRTLLAVPMKDASGSVVAVLQAVNKLAPTAAAADGGSSAPSGSGSSSSSSTADSDAEEEAAAAAPVVPSSPPAAGETAADWPQFTEADVTNLGAVCDIVASVLQRLVLAALASREKARSELMVSVMRQVSTASTSARLADVVTAVLDASYKLLDAQRVTLFLVDESRTSLIIASSRDAEGATVPITQGLAGYCATTGMPLCIADAYRDPRFDPSLDAATGFKTGSVLCVPIRDATGDVVGVLQAINRTVNGASPFEAFLTHNGVPPAAGVGGIGATRTPPAAYRSIDTPRGWAPSAAGFAAASGGGSGGAVLEALEAEVQAGMSPAYAAGEVVRVWPFTVADVELFEGMAAHAAVALRSAQILDETSRARRMTSALLDIVQSTAADSGTTVSELVQKIVDATYALLDCERVTLYLVDSVKQELWMAVAKDSEAVGARIPLGQGLAGFVARTGTALNIPDAYHDSRFDHSFDAATGYRTRSVLVWPIALTRRPTLSPTTDDATGGEGGTAVIAVLQAINKRSNSMRRVASTKLLRTRIGSLFGGMKAPGSVVAGSRGFERTHGGGGGGGGGGGAGGGAGGSRSGCAGGRSASAAAAAAAAGAEYEAFDNADERVMAAFCAEVAVALKRRSVEAAFMKVLADSAKSGVVVPDDLNVSLLALYTDAGTSARLHTSVQVRSMSVERAAPPLSWPTAIRLMKAARGAASRSRTAVALARMPSVTNVLNASGAAGAVGGEGGADAATATATAAAASSTVAGLSVPPASALSLAVSLSASNPEDELLTSDDALLTWSWNVFDNHITGVAAVMADPVLAFDVAAAGGGSSGGGGGAGRAMPFGAGASSAAGDALAMGEAALVDATVSMFRQFALLRRFDIEEPKFLYFVQRVRARYHPNPFHNWYHAVSALHAAFLVLGTTSAGDMLSYRDVLGCMIAALGHDIDHPGHNNAYEVNSYSPLALTHNDDAVLERHHAHMLFRVLFEPKADILAGMPAAELRALRTTIVRGILHTDMSKHFTMVADLAERATRTAEALAVATAAAAAAGSGGLQSDTARSGSPMATAGGGGGDDAPVALVLPTEAADHTSLTARSDGAADSTPVPAPSPTSSPPPPGEAPPPMLRASLPPLASPAALPAPPPVEVLPFDRNKEDDRNALVSTIVHLADLSGQAYPGGVSTNWSARILAEFRAQAAKERTQGLPTAQFMATLDTPLQCARLQHSFVSNIVLPLWLRVSDLLPGLAEPVANLQSARAMFEAQAARYEAATAAGAGVAAAPAAAAAPAVAAAAALAARAAMAPMVPPRHHPMLSADRSIVVGSEADEAERLRLLSARPPST